jgi:RNA-directed DNA polymerase
MKRATIQYATDHSPLYELSSRRRMCVLLKCTMADLSTIRRTKTALYSRFETRDRYQSSLAALAHKPRPVQAPQAVLAKVQARLMELLSRIELPAYLHSARRHCSYKTNAAQHAFGHSVAKIDVKKFYESTRASYVFRYYREVLKCSPDVAHRLTEITCLDKRLPTGSPLSPIMSFLAYREMFDELHNLAQEMGLKMTVYVDDVVVSGPGKASAFIEPAKKIIGTFGLRAHKFSVIAAGAPIVITGVHQDAKGSTVPSGRHRKIRALKEEYRNARTDERRIIYLKALVGQYREAADFIVNSRAHAMVYQRLLDKFPEALKASKKRRKKGGVIARTRPRVAQPKALTVQSVVTSEATITLA